jgi:hypothetical protein
MTKQTTSKDFKDFNEFEKKRESPEMQDLKESIRKIETWSKEHDHNSINSSPIKFVPFTQNIGNLLEIKHNDTLADEAYYDLPIGSGMGELMAGDNEEWTQFRYTMAGVVTLLNNTANVVATDTDTNICIFQNGSQVRIKNRLGSSKIIKFKVNY